MDKNQLEDLKEMLDVWWHCASQGDPMVMCLTEVDRLDNLAQSYGKLLSEDIERKECLVAVCSQCDKATERIYEDYSCANCRIKILEDALDEQSVVNQDYLELMKEESHYQDYKIAYQVLLKEYARISNER